MATFTKTDILVVSLALPSERLSNNVLFLCWHQPLAPGNITASINFCEGPDFHHSDVLAEPVNVSGMRKGPFFNRDTTEFFGTSSVLIPWSHRSFEQLTAPSLSQVATSMLFYMPVGLIGLLGPAWKEGKAKSSPFY